MAFRLLRRNDGLVIAPPRSRAAFLFACALWNGLGFWMLAASTLRFVALAAALTFAALALRSTRSTRITVGGGVLRVGQLEVALADIVDVSSRRDDSTTYVSVVLGSGAIRDLPLELDSIVFELRGSGRAPFDGRAKPEAVEALLQRLRDTLDEARRSAVGYRRVASGPEALEEDHAAAAGAQLKR